MSAPSATDEVLRRAQIALAQRIHYTEEPITDHDKAVAVREIGEAFELPQRMFYRLHEVLQK